MDFIPKSGHFVFNYDHFDYVARHKSRLNSYMQSNNTPFKRDLTSFKGSLGGQGPEKNYGLDFT